MKLSLLGTSSMIPTIERNHAASLLSFKDEHLLIDCGEGTQRQLRRAKISPAKITRILLSHWHGDHVLGLPGLLLTLAASSYTKTLHVYGPEGTKRNMELLFSFFVKRETVPYVVHEISKGKVFERDDFFVEALPLRHGTPCLGYRFVERDRRKILVEKLHSLGVKQGPLLKHLQKGEDIVVGKKKILAKDVTKVVKGRTLAFVTDTRFCKEAVLLAKDVDLFVCEATFAQELQEMAAERLHMTSVDAARIAKEACAKKLVLIHFSQRYKDLSGLLAEAKAVFEETVLGNDFDVFSI